jgi:hypothetical protein
MHPNQGSIYIYRILMAMGVIIWPLFNFFLFDPKKISKVVIFFSLFIWTELLVKPTYLVWFIIK